MEMSLQERNEGKFIYYKGQYWLVHNYMKEINSDTDYHGWFASPLLFSKDDGVKVAVGLGNWCYVVNGAFYKQPEPQVIEKAYLNYLEHLQWCKKIQSTVDNETPVIDELIQYYNNLLTKLEEVAAY